MVVSQAGCSVAQITVVHTWAIPGGLGVRRGTGAISRLAVSDPACSSLHHSLEETLQRRSRPQTVADSSRRHVFMQHLDHGYQPLARVKQVASGCQFTTGVEPRGIDDHSLCSTITRTSQSTLVSTAVSVQACCWSYDRIRSGIREHMGRRAAFILLE